MDTILHFHGDDVRPSPPEKALFHVIPVPLEQSVSYGTGTAGGPRAILEASAQLELFTGRSEPAGHGIYTAAPVDCSGPVEAVLARIEAQVAGTVALGKIPVLLGGEHTLSGGAVAALQRRRQRFGVVQFDAHADLRDTYQGSPWSHACVMRRVHEQGIPLCQLGTRSYSRPEHDYRIRHRIPYADSATLCSGGAGFEPPKDFPEQIYLSFDIDALDSALMPATGTPVPGGLGWYQALDLIARVLEERVCLGFDLVELAPLDGLHGPSFTAAQLVYDIMGILTESRVNREFYRI